MSKVFVIPDIHLKPWMFDEAEEQIEKTDPEKIVFLGDMVDDWHQEYNTDLYNETFNRALSFIEKYKDRLYWCIGNHDISYAWKKHESGYSTYMEDLVARRNEEIKNALLPGRYAFVFAIDETLFSHAGVTKDFFMYNPQIGDVSKESVVYLINKMGPNEMWSDSSPIWARPQDYSSYRWTTCSPMWEGYVYQVVGHTPVREPLKQGNLLTLDTFSTYSNGERFGNSSFVLVDSCNGEWKYSDKEIGKETFNERNN